MFTITNISDYTLKAAGLSVRSIFHYHGSTPQSDCDAYLQRLIWADGSGSDLFAILKSYKVCTRTKTKQN